MTRLPNSALDTENVTNTVSRSLVLWSLLLDSLAIRVGWSVAVKYQWRPTLSKLCLQMQEIIHAIVIYKILKLVVEKLWTKVVTLMNSAD